MLILDAYGGYTTRIKKKLERKIKIDLIYTHENITSELDIFGVLLSMSSNSLYKVVSSYLVEIIVICRWGGCKK